MGDVMANSSVFTICNSDRLNYHLSSPIITDCHLNINQDSAPCLLVGHALGIPRFSHDPNWIMPFR